jgi:cytoskeletal protein CcmA (bactofilin family)
MNPNEGSTAIGKSVVVRGQLSGNEDLYLDGDLEGTITLTENRLTLGPNARVVADLHVRDLVMLGNLKGNVRASGRIELRQSAVLTGDIVASRLSIEDSAVIKGHVELITAPTPAAAPAASAAPATPPAPAPASPSASSVLEPKA